MEQLNQKSTIEKPRLIGDISANKETAKEFMVKLSELMLEFQVDRVNVCWPGPWNFGPSRTKLDA